jgi:hypothetical protein
MAKRTESTIVQMKRVRSKPRLVWWAVLKLSPPKAPPKPASDCCMSIEPIKRTERIICIYGNIPEILFIVAIIPANIGIARSAGGNQKF